MKKYQCTVCQYIYDPAEGDPDSGIEPGTAFEDLPDDWVCPQCGASKEDFEELFLIRGRFSNNLSFLVKIIFKIYVF